MDKLTRMVLLKAFAPSRANKRARTSTDDADAADEDEAHRAMVEALFDGFLNRH
jgi:hypothetical protein